MIFKRMACLFLIVAWALPAQAALVAYYPFNEGTGTTVGDASGRNNHGRIVGTASWVPGKSGTALYLNGLTEVNLGDRSDLHFPTPHFTIMLWVQPQRGTTTKGELDAFWSLTGDRTSWAGPGYWASFFSSECSGSYTQPEHYYTIECVFRRDGWDNRIETSADPDKNQPSNNSIEIVDGQWHHIAIRVDQVKTNCAIFVDGVWRSKPAGNLINNFYEPSTGDVILGNSRVSWGDKEHWRFRGLMDEVKFFNTPLSTADILREMGDAPPPPAAPDAPSGLSAAALSSTEIRVSWRDNAENETRFKIRRSLDGVDFDALAPVFLPADTSAYTDAGLEPGTTYWYKVRAENGAGVSAYTAPASATAAAAAPAAPSGVSAAALSSTEIRVSWQDNAENETRFKVRRSTDGVDFDTLTPVFLPADTSAYTDSGLEPGTTYWCKVRAENDAGVSAYTTPVSAATLADVSDCWTAYNDLGWFAGQISTRITTFTTTDVTPGGVCSGQLVDYASGQTLAATLSVTGGGDVLLQGNAVLGGTDAASVFAGRVDTAGLVSYGDQDLVLRFENLDPGLRYEVVVYSDRGKPAYEGATARLHRSQLTGALSFQNAGTAGTTLSSTSTANDTTTYNAGYNTAHGYVARYRDIDPGGNGAFSITLVQDAANACYTYANAVRIRVMRSMAETLAETDTDADGMADEWEVARFGGLDATGGAREADADGDGVSNGDEFVTGTDPRNGSAYLAVQAALEAGHVSISFPTIQAAGAGYEGLGRYYALQTVDDPARDDWRAVPGFQRVLGTGRPVTLVVDSPPAGAPGYYRVAVWLEE